MGLTRVTAPATTILSLAEAWLHLRLDPNDGASTPEDSLITSLIAAATSEIDGGPGWLNRALITQTWKLTLDEFPCWQIRLPLPPLQSVTHVKYIDANGTEQTLSSALYRVMTDGEPGYIEPIYNGSWPVTRDESGAVRITFVCGYGAASAVPELIKAYMKFRVGQMFEHREAVIAGAAIAEVPWAKEMLASYIFRGNYP